MVARSPTRHLTLVQSKACWHCYSSSFLFHVDLVTATCYSSKDITQHHITTCQGTLSTKIRGCALLPSSSCNALASPPGPHSLLTVTQPLLPALLWLSVAARAAVGTRGCPTDPHPHFRTPQTPAAAEQVAALQHLHVGPGPTPCCCCRHCWAAQGHPAVPCPAAERPPPPPQMRRCLAVMSARCQAPQPPAPATAQHLLLAAPHCPRSGRCCACCSCRHPVPLHCCQRAVRLSQRRGPAQAQGHQPWLQAGGQGRGLQEEGLKAQPGACAGAAHAAWRQGPPMPACVPFGAYVRMCSIVGHCVCVYVCACARTFSPSRPVNMHQCA